MEGYRKILFFVFIGLCTNIYKKFREVTELYQKAQIENMELSRKIKQYEQLILKGYTEKFESRKSLVDSEIDNLKANEENLKVQLQQYQREG